MNIITTNYWSIRLQDNGDESTYRVALILVYEH